MEKSKSMQRPEPKLALITPSASPPSSHPFPPHPYRIPDQASPTKRARLSSAPRQIQPHTSSSSSSGPLDAMDFHKAREESTMRLLDVWAGLAERYSRPLDEDDIIDITTGEVVKDRGVVRAFQKGTVGAFVDPEDDDEDGVEENEDEDGVDELDAFANPGLHDIEFDGRGVPPVREVDPRDAEDLREFLEAERSRREVYGSEVDDTEGSLDDSQTDDAYTEESRYSAPADASSFDDATPEEDEDDDDTSNAPDESQTPHRGVSVHTDLGSDDELDNWEYDEASIVYRLPKTDDSDSEVEIVDPPAKAPSPSPEIPFTSAKTMEILSRDARKRRTAPVQRQLQTPPQSQTPSSIPSATPDDYFVQLSPASSPPRSSSRFSSQYCSSPIRPEKSRQHSSKPRSEHKRTPASYAKRAGSTHPIPRLDLAKVSGERPMKPSLQHPSATSHVPEASTLFSTSLSKPRRQSVFTPKIGRAKGTPKPTVEVVIEKRPPFQATKALNNASESSEQEVLKKDNDNARKSGTSARAKGKQKAMPGDEWMESLKAARDSDDEIVMLLSPTSSRKETPRPPQSRPRRLSASDSSSISMDARVLLSEHDSSMSTEPKYEQVPLRKASTAGKKRKRIVSSAENDSDLNELPPQQSTDSESVESEAIKEPDIKHKENQRSVSKQCARSSDYDIDDISQEEYDEQLQQERHFSRAPPHFGDHPYYPYPQPPYPPPHPHEQQLHPRMYAPIPDPRAQLIITQALHQLSALVGGAWTPLPPPPGSHIRGSTPFMPSRHRHYRTDVPGSIYSTPTHHPHPYPYAYDPNMSRATLPPDSPEVRSSSPLMESVSGGGRRKSLVRRSQSRGRRVSFRLEEGVMDTMEISASPAVRGKGDCPPRDREKTHRVDSAPKEHASVMQKKGRGKEVTRRKMPNSDSEAEVEVEVEVETLSRGRSSMRSQTPGPPAYVEDLRSAKQKVTATSRGRSRSRPPQSTVERR
ncbi:hypothetical protein D9615_002803 [Tricholomella constricta]|uniref:Uncharacterized protein n=1 Tax=Tricholomella constricta TaxID=117010 RepID=A0A8H5M606_9AGAR|nr:hypothetical protein D9615_002803 [Tricholomella constricta]